MPLFLYDAKTYTHADLVAVVRQQLALDYRQSDNLRTAVMYCPLVMTSGEFVKAAAECGIKENTARNRYSEIRRQQKEDGEI